MISIYNLAETKRNRQIVTILGLLGFAALLLYTIFFRSSAWMDEKWYMKNVPLLEQYGISREFLMKSWGPAGPLYAFVHEIFKPITHLNINNMRLLNVCFAGLTCLFIWLILKVENTTNPLANSVALFSVPTLYVCGGMALTEMPAMLFITAGIYMLLCALKAENGLKKQVLALSGGLAMSLAIIGRQPYLVVPFVVILLLLYPQIRKTNFLTVVVFFISALAIPLSIFSVWHNLQPPMVQGTGEGLSLFHGFLALGYGALTILFIAPEWFYIPKRQHYLLVAGGAAVILLLNLFVFKVEFLPMVSLLQKYLPASWLGTIAKSFAAVNILVGCYLLLSGLMNCLTDYTKYTAMLFTFSAFLILLCSAKITHQFSSRYVLQAAPFMVLMVVPQARFTWWRIIGTALAVILGLMSLNSFVNN